ncbi:tyrosyl-DNA phosphodiesterase 2 [Chanos chanos]|uniref:Tyrosyl-DNA phosphodiesterase 2 n=1 Tax=Chanos chanos TaxID=29144 RepID=A0A6J2W100_CHACN|nr:tyrosyl-DNA phosphodiesterase 2-like [Chanos chanos]
MDGKPDYSESHTEACLPARGDGDTRKSLESNIAQGNSPMKTGRQKKRRSRVRSKTTDAAPKTATSPSQIPLHQFTKPAEPLTIHDNSDKQTHGQSTSFKAVHDHSLQPIHDTSNFSTDPDGLIAEAKSTQTLAITLSACKQAYLAESAADLWIPDGQPVGATLKDLSGDPNQLTVLTWNIDGLDGDEFKERTLGLLYCLGKLRPDVILLQELIQPSLRILQHVMKDYEILTGADEGYFTGMLLRKSRVQLLQSNIVKYPTTEMGRNLLIANVIFSGIQLCVMTSHLESCKASSQERMNQLRRVWKRMREAPDDQTVIFGGDTNLRDKEVKKLGGVPDGIFDVWETLGEPEDCKYTWDTVNNDNKDVDFDARLRFDRVYMRSAKDGTRVTPEKMTLEGMKRLMCGLFISDHWGILCTFSVRSSEE